MSSDHWFDQLHRTLVREVPRREVLRVAAGLAATALFGSALDEAGAKTRKDPCDKTFAKPKDRDFCKVKRRRCGKAGTTFCIIEGKHADPSKLATCCEQGDQCCHASLSCCPADHVCCTDPAGPLGCCPPDHECCPDDPRGCCPRRDCPVGQELCAGACIYPVIYRFDPKNCGRCGNACDAGQRCCYGACYEDPGTIGCPLPQ